MGANSIFSAETLPHIAGEPFKEQAGTMMARRIWPPSLLGEELFISSPQGSEPEDSGVTQTVVT